MRRMSGRQKWRWLLRLPRSPRSRSSSRSSLCPAGGELFNEMVVTICFSLSLSLLVALTLVPLLASRFLGRHRITRLPLLLDRLGRTVGTWLDDLHRVYAKALGWCVHHRKQVLWYSTGAFVLSVVVWPTWEEISCRKSDMGSCPWWSIVPGNQPDGDGKERQGAQRPGHECSPEAEMVFINFGQGEGIMAIFSSQSSNEGT